MKKNFIVSGLKKLWMDEINDKFILDPFIYYELKKNKEIQYFDSIERANYRRKTKEDLVCDSNFINKKVNKYIPIIGERLNTIHNKKFDSIFWTKALSISLERYVTCLFEVYANCKANFNPDLHKCNILSLESFYTPISFDKQRDLFQHSHIGKEQIFSLYIRYHKISYTKEIELVNNLDNKKKNKWFHSFLSKLKKINYNLLKREVLKKLYNNKNHTIGIHGSFFSNKDLNDLMIRSRGKIYPFSWNIDFNYNTNKNWNNERNILGEYKTDFDNFDRFFFYTIKYFFPMEFIENFSKVLKHYNMLFNNNSSLKYITSEAWPSCSTLSIGLAYLKTKGVKHIYNEHNYFAHPYINNELDKAIKLVDIFTSLGWYDKKYPNMKASNSLFNFKIKKKNTPVYNICYITDVKQTNMSQITPSYGTSCENTLKYYDFVKLLFFELSDKTIKTIYLREYPKNISAGWLHYDDSYMLQPYYDKMKKIDSVKETGKQSIAKSKLVIIDYLSTAHLESLVSDIPTIFFHNKNTYYLKDNYTDYFDPLIDCGICQTDPVKAARFIEGIKDNPSDWWYSNTVRENRKIFLEKNLADNNHLQNYLFGIS